MAALVEIQASRAKETILLLAKAASGGRLVSRRESPNILRQPCELIKPTMAILTKVHIWSLQASRTSKTQQMSKSVGPLLNKARIATQRKPQPQSHLPSKSKNKACKQTQRCSSSTSSISLASLSGASTQVRSQ